MEQLQNMIGTLDQQKQDKRDYLLGRDNLHFINGNLYIVKDGTEIKYTPTAHFHSQVAEKLKIPKNYYDRMLSNSSLLLDENVNHWMKENDKNMLVRTFEQTTDNIARGLLSDSYNIIDNYDVLFETLDAIKKSGITVEIKNAELSDTRMYLKVTAPEIEIQAKEMLRLNRLAIEVGSGVIAGFVVQNSEVGNGAFNITPRAVVLACGNGQVYTNDQLRKIHLGAKMDEFFANNEKIREANMKLIQEQIQHAVKTFLSKDHLQKIVNFYTEMGDKKIEAPLANVIDVTAKEYGFSEARKASILDYFIQGGDTRRIGLVSAITEELQGLGDPDQKHDSEVAAFDLLTNFDKIESKAFAMKPSSN